MFEGIHIDDSLGDVVSYAEERNDPRNHTKQHETICSWYFVDRFIGEGIQYTVTQNFRGSAWPLTLLSSASGF